MTLSTRHGLNLQEKYCATVAEENYPELDQAFSDCKLVGTKKDPELWFNDLDHLNMGLARINLKYEKDDLKMKSHMMTSMLNDDQSVIIKFRGDLNKTSLAKLHKEVVPQFKGLIKGSSGGTGSESVLSANMSKHPYKKFKGTCRNGGKIGHKAHECRSAKVKATDGATAGASTTSGDKSQVICFNCQKRGHFANKCTFPKKLKSEANTDMGMFVGVAISDTAEDMHKTFGCYVFENFLDNVDDSVAFGDDDKPCDLCPFWAVDGKTPEDTEPLPAEVREKDDSIHEHVANAASGVPLDESESAIVEAAGSKANTIVNYDYVGWVSTTGQAEEWLLDSGAEVIRVYSTYRLLWNRRTDVR